MKHVVGVADMKVSAGAGDEIVTHALGSCLGISLYDPVVRLGGLLHVMLPQSSVNPEKAKANPCMFVDTAVPALFRAMYDAGGQKGRLVVKVAGGANVNEVAGDRFAIGHRNYVMLKKLFWQNGVLIKSEDVGGSSPRTLYLDVDTGRTWLSVAGREKEL